MMPRRRAGSPPAPPNPTRRRLTPTPISNPEPAMEMDISLLQETGRDRDQMSRFHVLPMMHRRRASLPPAPPNPTQRRQSLTPISNPDLAMEMDISLLQERGRDRDQMSRFHVRSPVAIALAPAAASPVTPITLVSNSHAGLFPETDLSDEEALQHSVVPCPQETVPQPSPLPAQRTIVPMRVDEKGKEPEEALKRICGVCLSEEHRATLQGLLNCCSHYFCFTCILEWSKAESRCPLCKRRFTTITVADVRSGLRNTAIHVEKRDQVYRPTEEESRRFLDPYENVICIECNQSGENNLMLQCDVCDSSAHTFCVGLGREVPEGNWYCGGCRSSVAGHSYAQTQDRVVDSSSSSFGRSVSSGVPQIPPPLNIRQPSLQEFNLNQSPMETPEEDRRAESHIPTEPVITPTGRHATLDTRRALNRRIRILLSRPRTATNARQNGVENFRDLANAKEQLIPIVKKSIKHISAQSPLDQSSYVNLARRATNTILALYGIAHNTERVVATPFHFPSGCRHACDGREPAFLMRTVCSPCCSEVDDAEGP